MKLLATDFAEVSRLLDAALDLPEEARADWVEGLAAREAPFKDTLRKLLAQSASVESEDFLGRLPAFGAGTNDAARAEHMVDVLANGTIGPYELIREIGRGGMAAVWLARRADGSINRRIALKLPFADVGGRRIAERFARERDILAGLAHARIARLYDAGVSATGQPYLAMEYIVGVPINDYSDSQRLNVQERLTLFLQVLDAAQHAHTQLVLHRDLKPTNILVTAEGQVVLLDFGIAKLLVDGEARDTELTHLGGRAMTLPYASPEQLTGGVLGTASDVYSLGVVLYEMLCGRRPYRLRRDSRQALEDAIIDSAVIRPSQSIGDPTIAQHRATTPKILARTLKGDLDTILLKALKKDPLERYRTAEAFAADLRRYLLGQPVQARSDGAGYLLRKFVARHRGTVALVGISAALLIATTAVSIWQARSARQQAALAQHEARRARAVQGFLLDLFRTNTDAQLDPVKAREMTARQMLDVGAQRVATDLSDQPEAQEAIEDTLADMYGALGLDREAERIKASRIDSLTRAYGERDPRVAAGYLDYAQGVYNTDGARRALPQLAKAQALLDAQGDQSSAARGQWLIDSARFTYLSSPGAAQRYADVAVAFFQQHPSPDDWLVTAHSYAARTRYVLGDFAGAEAGYRAALAQLAFLKVPSPSTELALRVGLAETETKRGRIADAERDFRSILETSQQRNGLSHLDTLQVETRLGAFLHATSRREEGRRLLLASVQTMQRDPALDEPNLALQVYRNYGLSLLDEGRIELADDLLTINTAARRVRDPGTVVLAMALRDLASVKTALGEYAESRTLNDEAFTIWRTAVGTAAQAAAANSYILAGVQQLIARGDGAAAQVELRRIATPTANERLPLDTDKVRAQIAESRADLLLGHIPEAMRSAAAAVELVRRSTIRIYSQILEADALNELGQAQRLAGAPAAARPNLERAVTLRAAADDPLSPWLAGARVELAECLLDLGQRSAANTLQQQASAALSTHPRLSDEFLRPLRQLTDRLSL